VAVSLRRARGLLWAAMPEPRDGAVVEVVAMRRRHVRHVVAIEERIFPRPWSSALYLSELSSPSTRVYLVALVDGAVVGYVGAMLVAGEGHVTTVGVAPTWQRRGVGIRMLHRLVSELRARGAHALTLEVRMSNRGAQQLYALFGFVPAGVRKDYYPEVNEDGLVMWAYDVDSEDYAERLARIAARIARTAARIARTRPDGPDEGERR
jgi:ribosomal-protein-alanine N-acetyltransferase